MCNGRGVILRSRCRCKALFSALCRRAEQLPPAIEWECGHFLCVRNFGLLMFRYQQHNHLHQCSSYLLRTTTACIARLQRPRQPCKPRWCNRWPCSSPVIGCTTASDARQIGDGSDSTEGANVCNTCTAAMCCCVQHLQTACAPRHHSCQRQLALAHYPDSAALSRMQCRRRDFRLCAVPSTPAAGSQLPAGLQGYWVKVKPWVDGWGILQSAEAHKTARKLHFHRWGGCWVKCKSRPTPGSCWQGSCWQVQRFTACCCCRRSVIPPRTAAPRMVHNQ